MSMGSELEPGPGRSRQQCGQNLVPRQGIPIFSRETQAKACAVGWGGFAGGEGKSMFMRHLPAAEVFRCAGFLLPE